MKLAKRFTMLTLIGLSLTSASAMAFFCDYHGGPRFGLYARHNPVIQQHITSSKSQEVSLKHPESVTASVNQPNLLEVTYSAPETYKDLILTFTASDGVKLVADTSHQLQDSKGKVTIVYIPYLDGEHQVEIMAQGSNNGAPYSRIQTISVNAQ